MYRFKERTTKNLISDYLIIKICFISLISKLILSVIYTVTEAAR